MSVQLLSVETLNGQLSEVLLDAEVDKLVVRDCPVVVSIVPKDVLQYVKDLIWIFVQNLDQSLLYLLLLEKAVLV